MCVDLQVMYWLVPEQFSRFPAKCISCCGSSQVYLSAKEPMVVVSGPTACMNQLMGDKIFPHQRQLGILLSRQGGWGVSAGFIPLKIEVKRTCSCPSEIVVGAEIQIQMVWLQRLSFSPACWAVLQSGRIYAPFSLCWPRSHKWRWYRDESPCRELRSLVAGKTIGSSRSSPSPEQSGLGWMGRWWGMQGDI